MVAHPLALPAMAARIVYPVALGLTLERHADGTADIAGLGRAEVADLGDEAAGICVTGCGHGDHLRQIEKPPRLRAARKNTQYEYNTYFAEFSIRKVSFCIPG